MLALNDIIDYLLGLLREPGALTAFEADPQASLAAAGLQGVTGQDIRDAQLVMADRGLARPADGAGSAGGADPVREIQHTTQHFHAEPVVTQSITQSITIDDRDTFLIRDGFNSDDDVTVIDDSFNEVAVDNSVDNRIDNSLTDSSVENDVVAIQDNDTTVVDASTDVTVVDVDTTGAQPAPEPDADSDPEPAPELAADPGLDPDPVLDAGPEFDAEPDLDPGASLDPVVG